LKMLSANYLVEDCFNLNCAVGYKQQAKTNTLYKIRIKPFA
jgi:hypothetical protein